MIHKGRISMCTPKLCLPVFFAVTISACGDTGSNETSEANTATTPQSAAITNVIDPSTNMTWARCSVGQKFLDSECSGAPASFSWQEAVAYAQTVKGWGLPTKDQLSSIVLCSNSHHREPGHGGQVAPCAGDFSRPVIDESIFPNTPLGIYWTLDEVETAHTNSYGWTVDFSYGGVYGYDKNTAGFIRLVRQD